MRRTTPGRSWSCSSGRTIASARRRSRRRSRKSSAAPRRCRGREQDDITLTTREINFMATAIASEKSGAAPKTQKNVGRVVQVIGPVLDVEFEPENLPEIYNALTLEDASGTVPVRLTAEVQQHIGQNQVRAVAMSSTDGVTRGMQVTDTGSAITAPVGEAALGRILNVLGEPVDGGPPLPKDTERWPIHRETPKFTDLEPKTEIFETGIKVIDLIAPFVKGGKIGLFGGAGVGK